MTPIETLLAKLLKTKNIAHYVTIKIHECVFYLLTLYVLRLDQTPVESCDWYAVLGG